MRCGVDSGDETRIGIDDRHGDFCDLSTRFAKVSVMFIIHAQSLAFAVPKENREIPPPDYPRAYQPKRDSSASDDVD